MVGNEWKNRGYGMDKSFKKSFMKVMKFYFEETIIHHGRIVYTKMCWVIQDDVSIINEYSEV